jgi:glycosyltransferase involved in cell wall biosynthesis
MGAPLVSVLVPVFNGERFLAECLDSVLDQDFEDLEVLLGDDGSTDGSGALIQRYAKLDSRIRWWRNPRNLGIGGNFNTCLAGARGRYMKYVLQDDKLLRASAVRRMVEVLEADPSISLVVSATLLIDEHSRAMRERYCFRESGAWDGKEVILHCLEQNANKIGEPSLAMFRREQAGAGYDVRFKQLLDLDFWFSLLEQGRFFNIAEPLCAFRQHPAQLSEVNRRTGASAGEELLLVEKCYGRPWFRRLVATDSATRWKLCRQLYYLRKDHGPDAPLAAAISGPIGRRTYFLWWLWHRLSRPVSNLRRHLEKSRGWRRLSDG